ncbi:EG45-like domain containing protein [Dendrobium catenatum]|uniref:EG45-like domain containing protein n=1 Tax=Dendrobium catenatum TaxID=906689 RepID=A0A2I0XCE3_9ASPA|nr:EG45-like domain containing protein [Dendrobium catenatum]
MYVHTHAAWACYGYQEMGTMVAAASDVIWDNHTACGRNYRVTCTGPTNEGESQPVKGPVLLSLKLLITALQLVVRPPLISLKKLYLLKQI